MNRPPLMIRAELYAFESSVLALPVEHDRALLPMQLLHMITKGGDREGPMLFMASVPRATLVPSNVRFVGVEGFTADDGTCYLPDDYMKSLGIRNGELVQLVLCELPKCTSVTLRQTFASRELLDELEDPCALLEAALKGRVCLQEDTSVELEIVGKRVSFDVVAVQPLFCSLVVDTDVELMLLPPIAVPTMFEPPLPASVTFDPFKASATTNLVDSSRLDSSRLDSSRLDSSRIDSSRLDSSRIDSLQSRLDTIVASTVASKYAPASILDEPEAPRPVQTSEGRALGGARTKSRLIE